MTASEFAAIVRKGSEKLRVDNLVLEAGDIEIHGKGVMHLGSEDITLDMTLDPNEKPPSAETGVWTQSDFWKLRGVVEDSLGFKCDYLGAGGMSRFESWGVHKVTLTFRLNPIDLLIVGWDAMTGDERSGQQRELLGKSGPPKLKDLSGQSL